MTGHITAVAAFATPELAARAVDELLSAGFDRAAIGRFSPDITPAGTGRGEAAGAAVADALTGQGVSEAEAQRSADALAQGRSVVSVRAGERASDAVRIFGDFGGEILSADLPEESGYTASAATPEERPIRPRGEEAVSTDETRGVLGAEHAEHADQSDCSDWRQG